MRALTIGTAILSMGLLAGCETRQQVVSQKEDMLAAAGFDARPADNPQRIAMMQKLPANRFVMRDVHGSEVYLYSDPIACNCVYFGSQAAYGRYREQQLKLRIANEQELAADSYEDSAFQFGAWGPGFWGPY